uniref:Uncharacterized protein n=1 Tax=Nothoprocta perdicaria TaxID=30464 RepID=A0A8C6Z9S7_NOTPE
MLVSDTFWPCCPWLLQQIPGLPGLSSGVAVPHVSSGPRGISTAAARCQSMLPDAVDDFRLRNPGATNLEALFYSFYVFFNKFAGGLAVGISTLTLHFAGYRAGDCTHKPSVVLALRLLMAPVPIGLLLLAVIIFCTYPIDEERRKEMRREMEAIGAPSAACVTCLHCPFAISLKKREAQSI